MYNATKNYTLIKRLQLYEDRHRHSQRKQNYHLRRFHTYGKKLYNEVMRTQSTFLSKFPMTV